MRIFYSLNLIIVPISLSATTLEGWTSEKKSQDNLWSISTKISL